MVVYYQTKSQIYKTSFSFNGLIIKYNNIKKEENSFIYLKINK